MLFLNWIIVVRGVVMACILWTSLAVVMELGDLRELPSLHSAHRQAIMNVTAVVEVVLYTIN